MKPLGVHHVSIGVTDLDAALEFYQQLGLTIVPNRPDFGIGGAWLQAGGQQVHLISTTIKAPGLENHLALQVADLQACVADLADVGITAHVSAPVPGAGAQAFLRDPCGNVVELNQPLG